MRKKDLASQATDEAVNCNTGMRWHAASAIPAGTRIMAATVSGFRD